MNGAIFAPVAHWSTAAVVATTAVEGHRRSPDRERQRVSLSKNKKKGKEKKKIEKKEKMIFIGG